MRVFCFTLILLVFSLSEIAAQQPSPTPSDAEQKKKAEWAEYERKLAEVNAKNAEITRINNIVQAALDEGNNAFNRKDYAGAAAGYDKGINAVPNHPGIPVLLTNKAGALRIIAVNSFNEYVRSKDEAEKGRKLDFAKKTIGEAEESVKKALAMLNQSDKPTTADAALFDANLYHVYSGLFETLKVAKKMGRETALADLAAAYRGLSEREKDPAKLSGYQKTYANALLGYYDAGLLFLEFEKLAAADPKNTDALWGTGWSLLQLGFKGNDLEKVRKSAAYFEKLLELDPEGSNHFDEAKRFHEAIKASPNGLPDIPPHALFSKAEFEDLLKKAGELYDKNKYAEALASALKASGMRPDDFRPYYFAGISYMAQWKMKSASDSYAKALSKAPFNKVLHYLKSRADRHRNAKEEAIAAAREAIKLDPGYAEAYEALADAQTIGADKAEYPVIVENLRKAIKLKPSLISAYDSLGEYLSLMKDYQSAEEVYRKAMELEPEDMSHRFSLGRMFVEKERLQEARKLWEGRSSDEDNTIPSFLTILERAERLKAATEALAKKPNNPDALLEMGLATMDGEPWMADGRQEKGLVYFQKALKIKPGFAKAQFAVCKVYVQLAYRDESKKKLLDAETAKLRKLNAKLVAEIEEYKKEFAGGQLRIGVANDDQ